MDASLKDLQRIPGVGKSLSCDLYDLGLRATSELAGQDPEALFEQLCDLRGQRVDRCVLYVFRCATYFADCEARGLEPELSLLRWWNWKDSLMNQNER